MKNILKISILSMVLGFSFYSCDDDDSIPNQDLLFVPTEVAVSLSRVSTDVSVPESGGQVVYNVDLTSALSYDLDVTLDVVSSDGSIETTTGLVELSGVGSATIASGDTTVTFTIDFIDDTVLDFTETYTFSIGSIVSSGSSSDSYLLDVSSSESILVTDTPDIITTAGDFDINLDWTGNTDLDLYLRDGDGSTIDYSWYSQPENITFLESYADGDYAIGVDDYYDSPLPTSCDLTLTFPDGQTLPLLDEATADFIWFQVTKLTNGSEVWYYIIQQ